MPETSQQLEPVVMPPLGGEPQWFKDYLDQRAEKQAGIDAVDYKTVEQFNDLPEVFGKLSDFAQAFQARYGVEPQPLDPTAVRIVTPEGMKEASEYADVTEASGFFDPETGNIFVERKKYGESRGEKLWFYYAMAHEVGHSLTTGLLTGVTRMDFVAAEGEADKFARDFMQTELMPSMYPRMKEETEKAVSSMISPHTRGGFDLAAEDYVYFFQGIHDTEQAVFARVLETRAMEALQAEVGEEVYSEFMERAITDDKSATNFLIGKLDEETLKRVMAPDIGEKQISAKAIIAGLADQ